MEEHQKYSRCELEEDYQLFEERQKRVNWGILFQRGTPPKMGAL